MIKLIPRAENGHRFATAPYNQEGRAQNAYYRKKAEENEVTWNPVSWAKEAYYRWMSNPGLGGEQERPVVTGMAPDLGVGKVVKAAKTASNAVKAAKAAKTTRAAAKSTTKSAKTKVAKKPSNTTQQGIDKARQRRAALANDDMKYRSESYYYPSGEKPHRHIDIYDMYNMPSLFRRDPRVVELENSMYFSPARKIK